MKKFKKMMVGLVLAVTLLGNCLSVSAAIKPDKAKCTQCRDNLYANEIYEKTLVYYELKEIRLVQTNPAVFEAIVNNYYRVRYKCRECGKETVYDIVEEEPQKMN